MTRRHPLLRLLPWWLAAALILVAGWCALPVERTVTSEPARLPITVLPTSTVYQFAVVTPSATVTPPEMVLMPTRTPGPSPTRTPMPTATPVPPTPDLPPVQRG